MATHDTAMVEESAVDPAVECGRDDDRDDYWPWHDRFPNDTDGQNGCAQSPSADTGESVPGLLFAGTAHRVILVAQPLQVADGEEASFVVIPG